MVLLTGQDAAQPATAEAILEPRLVMKGDDERPFVEGEFFVAAYQRGYRWGRHEVRQLLDDIRANAREAELRKALASDYYLQPIVVLRRPDGTWELVDGQQRLTTLFLITKFVATKFTDASVSYTLTYETRDRDGFSSSEFLTSVGTEVGEEHRSDNIDFHHIAAAYDAIVEWFGEQPNAGQAAIDIHSALSKWVYVIWYEAPSDTDPNALFTRLNRDRIPLTDSELIKALVLSKSGAADGKAGRQQEIAAQWDGFERDLRDEQFWAFLTRSTDEQPTHIDLLFESMTPTAGHRVRPRYWTFGEVQKEVTDRGAATFWQEVVERHGLLTGWFEDRELYHRIGYLIQIGESIGELIAASRSVTHSEFRRHLVARTQQRLNLSPDRVSLLRYGKDNAKCTDVLLLMNVETVLGSADPGSRFSFRAYVDTWSLEHIHAQNSEAFKKESERRDWLRVHLKRIESTEWPAGQAAEVNELVEQIRAHLAMEENATNQRGFDAMLSSVFSLFSTPSNGSTEDDMNGLGNLALLQRDVNSKLNNAVFAIKRERLIELDHDGAYVLPCTRNAFLKYYTPSGEQQLSLWGPEDQHQYYSAMIDKIAPYLTSDELAMEGHQA